MLCRLVEGPTLHEWLHSQLQHGAQALEQHVKTLLVELLEVSNVCCLQVLFPKCYPEYCATYVLTKVLHMSQPKYVLQTVAGGLHYDPRIAHMNVTTHSIAVRPTHPRAWDRLRLLHMGFSRKMNEQGSNDGIMNYCFAHKLHMHHDAVFPSPFIC